MAANELICVNQTAYREDSTRSYINLNLKKFSVWSSFCIRGPSYSHIFVLCLFIVLSTTDIKYHNKKYHTALLRYQDICIYFWIKWIKERPEDSYQSLHTSCFNLLYICCGKLQWKFCFINKQTFINFQLVNKFFTLFNQTRSYKSIEWKVFEEDASTDTESSYY